MALKIIYYFIISVVIEQNYLYYLWRSQAHRVSIVCNNKKAHKTWIICSSREPTTNEQTQQCKGFWSRRVTWASWNLNMNPSESLNRIIKGYLQIHCIAFFKFSVSLCEVGSGVSLTIVLMFDLFFFRHYPVYLHSEKCSETQHSKAPMMALPFYQRHHEHYDRAYRHKALSSTVSQYQKETKSKSAVYAQGSAAYARGSAGYRHSSAAGFSLDSSAAYSHGSSAYDLESAAYSYGSTAYDRSAAQSKRSAAYSLDSEAVSTSSAAYSHASESINKLAAAYRLGSEAYSLG